MYFEGNKYPEVNGIKYKRTAKNRGYITQLLTIPDGKLFELENKVAPYDGQKINQKSQVMLKGHPFERFIFKSIYYHL